MLGMSELTIGLIKFENFSDCLFKAPIYKLYPFPCLCGFDSIPNCSKRICFNWLTSSKEKQFAWIRNALQSVRSDPSSKYHTANVSDDVKKVERLTGQISLDHKIVVYNH